MSSYYYAYQAYQSDLYGALCGFALLAAVLVIGWYGVRALFSRSKRLDLIERFYLVYCSVTYVLITLIFWEA